MIRAQRWLILLFVVLFGGAAFAYSARQNPVYEAEAALAFKEPTQDLSVLGLSPTFTAQPQQRAAINAELVTRTSVARRVREALEIDADIEDIQDSVSAQAEAQTNLVVIEARAGNDQVAAALANEFAEQAAALTNREERERLEEAERSLRRSFREQSRRGRVSTLEQATYADRLSRIQALQDFGSAVEVTRRADVPSTPASPNPVLNTTLGIVLGLVLGLLAAFARDSLDLRLRSARDIQAHAKLPLVGHIGDDAMGSAGVASQNGRKLDPADLESFRILRKNLEFLDIDRPLRTIAVTSALPEEGKSTVAAALAGTFAQGGITTLLVECDLRRPALAERLGLKSSPGLSDYLAERAAPDEVLQTVRLRGSDGSGNGNGSAAAAIGGGEELVCITAGSPVPRPADVLASQRFRDFLNEVSEAYEAVILDTSPLLSVSDTLELIPNVDGVVLCVRAGRTRRNEVKAAREALDHLPERPAGLVVTGIRPGDEADYGYYSATYAYGPAGQGH